MKNNLVDLKAERIRWNQRWRFDPAFKRDFNYEKPEYADCPDDMRWLLPLAEYQKSPEFKAVEDKSRQRVKQLAKELSRETIKVVSE